MAKEKRLSASHRDSKCLPSYGQGKSILFVRDPLLNQCKALSSQPAPFSTGQTGFFGVMEDLEMPLLWSSRCQAAAFPAGVRSTTELSQFLPSVYLDSWTVPNLKSGSTASKNQGHSLVLVWLFCCGLQDILNIAIAGKTCLPFQSLVSSIVFFACNPCGFLEHLKMQQFPVIQ